MARRERQLHQQLYPGWTARDNYAINQKKKKKKRDKSADGGESHLLVSLAISPLISLSLSPHHRTGILKEVSRTLRPGPAELVVQTLPVRLSLL